jgi:hypothetical protein
VANIEVIRFKRFESKDDRMQHSDDWYNPARLGFGELADLKDLYGPGSDVLRKDDFEAADKAGTVMIAAYDKGDLTRSQYGRIVGFLTMTIATLPGRKKAYVNDVRVNAECSALVSEALLKAAVQICEGLRIARSDIDISSVQNMRPSRARVSGVSMIKRVDRLDHPPDERREADEDGPSTTQVRIPTSNG